MPQLAYNNVGIAYESDDSRVVALRDFNLTVLEGQSVAVIGPSGCGKSTMLRMAAGLVTPTCGTVCYDGAPIMAPRLGTALILQDFGLLPWKTVLENAALGLQVRKVGRAARLESARNALQSVGLSDFANSYPGQLSGGMKQRLALARALALDVDTLLMDEPLSALDAMLREQMQELLLEQWLKHGYTQVLVTHSIEEAVYLGRRIVVMQPRPGRVVATVENPGAGSAGYRTKPEFFELCGQVRALLDQAQHEAGDGCVG